MYNFNDLIQEFLYYSKLRGLTVKTLKKYKVHLKLFNNYLADSSITNLNEINSFVIRRFLHSLVESGKAESYANSFLKTIRAFYVFCEKEELVEMHKNPCLKVEWLKVTEPIIVPFSDSEVINMIKYADRTRTQKSSTPFSRYISERDAFLVMILADTGVRAAELCNIKDSDFSENGILVKKGKNKKQRVVYASDLVVKQYYKYKRVQNPYFIHRKLTEVDEYLFLNKDGEQMTVDSLQRIIKRLAKLAEVRPEIRSSPHTFRHFAAHKLLNNTNNIYTVAKILGHSRVSTSEIYLKSIVDDKFISEIKKYSPLSSYR